LLRTDTLSSHRYAPPSGPWLWTDFKRENLALAADTGDIWGICVTTTLGDTEINEPWGQYLQLLGNQNIENERRDGTVYCTDMLDDGMFRSDAGNRHRLTTSDFWRMLQQGVSYVSFAY